MDVQGMFTNDIVGSPKGDNGFVDPNSIRLFGKGIPSTENASTVATRESIGGENDSPARELARFTQEVASNSVTGMSGMSPRLCDNLVLTIIPCSSSHISCRPFPAWRRSRTLPLARLSCCSLHRTTRELRPPTPGRSGRPRDGRAVRRLARVLRLRLHNTGCQSQRCSNLVTCPGPRYTDRCNHRHLGSDEQ